MSQLLTRLTYASKANFTFNKDGSIEAEVARILLQSRRNNPKDSIGGVLHYGNGYFFQCLEGERDSVNKVYEKIAKDPRHTDVQLLTMQSIDTRLFSDWSMKYLPVEEDLNTLLEQFGMASFDPYAMDEKMINAFLEVCVSGFDPSKQLERESDKQDETQGNSVVGWLKRFLSAA